MRKLRCELCGKLYKGTTAHPRGTDVCPACMKGQLEFMIPKKNKKIHIDILDGRM